MAKSSKNKKSGTLKVSGSFMDIMKASVKQASKKSAKKKA